jgi:hypothetical protein
MHGSVECGAAADAVDWKNALVSVKPKTFNWHEQAFQLFWRWKSPGGRPGLPKDIGD